MSQHIRSFRALAPLTLAFALVAACESSTSPGNGVEPIDRLPRDLSITERELIEVGNAFAFDLLRAVSGRTDDNVFLSPLSVSMALGMALNGAAGETFDAMRRTLGHGEAELEAINAAYRDLIRLLVDLDRSVDIGIGNSVWHHQDFAAEPPFLDAARTYFDAEVEGLDFRDPAAPDVINAWVAERTKGRIPTIIDSIDPYEIMFLVNAVYFKASWVDRFDPAETRPAPFRRSDGTEVTTPMMNREGKVRSRWTKTAMIVDLPYGGGAFSMTIAVPRVGIDLDDLIEGLDPETWQEWTDGLVETSTILSMPKFELKFKSNLANALTDLGMGIAFSMAADFSRLSREHRLALSRVEHSTYVKVDEEGTEAAAATAVGVSLTSMPPPARIDRPFVFAIRERHSGAILFIGKVEDPTAG